ncbi:MAG: nucleoside phosphorylase [Chloroflexota bacterium]
MPDADPLVTLPDTDRQYHIDLAPGEVADYILLPGDPDRTDRIAELLDEVEVHRRHREFNSVTGTHRGLRISVVATGIGTDNVEIVIAEILAIAAGTPTFIRIGSCGTLREDIGLGELIVTTGAVRLESTTAYYVEEGYPAVAHYAAVAAVLEAAHRCGQPAHAGLTATAPGFYGPQGRPIPQLPIRHPDLAERMARQGVVNFEMEASAVLTLAALAGCRAGVVCTVFAQRTAGQFVTGDQKASAEAGLIETGLEALHVLAEMDEQQHRSGEMHWRPSHWAPDLAT